MKVKDLLDAKVQVFNTVNDNVPSQIMTTRQVLDFGTKYMPLINKARSLYFVDSNSYKETKNRMFAWLPSTLTQGDKSNIVHTYPILCIDIDGKDNPDMDMEEAKQQIFSLPFVYYVGLSIGGNGFFALAYIEDILYFEEHFNALKLMIKEKFNLNIDTQCKNPNRLRYISYDDNPLVKDDDLNIKPFTDVSFKQQMTYTPDLFSIRKSSHATEVINDDRFCISVLDYCINKLYYQSGKRSEGWIQDLGLFKLFGAEGEMLALQMSRQSQGYVSDADVIHVLHKGRLNSKRERMSKFFKQCKDSLGKGWIYRIKEMYNLD
jgi:hypothetical protein